MKTGHILDSIQVNGQRFGGEGGDDTTTINLGQNEYIISIEYNFATNGYTDGTLCNLKIYSNNRTLGPYAIGYESAYCNTGGSVSTRSISNGAFLEYMQQHAGSNTDGFIVLN